MRTAPSPLIRSVIVFISLLSVGRHALCADEPIDAFAANQRLSDGVNLGNALEAPAEGQWGMTLKEEYFDAIAQAGFNSVRIPIRWSAHAATEAPFTIDSKFFERIDWAIEQGLSRKLAVVINVHHYEEMDKAPADNLPRLKAIWKQIAQRYRDRSNRLYFEILNEPHDQLTDERWQATFPEVLAVIRASNHERFVIIGPGQWNNVDHLQHLTLPEDDRRLIATFHLYSPFEFTHQGASWVPGSNRWKGHTWTATAPQLDALRADLQKAADWSRKHNRPVYLGEFGSYGEAPMASRLAWMEAVVREARERELSWCYWEFGAGFGVYDRDAGAWRKPMLEALLPKK